MRTPHEAYFVEHDLRVPHVARFTGRPLRAEDGKAAFPQARYGPIAQDGGDLWFAWDREHLYA